LERAHLEYLVVDGKTILKYTFNMRGCGLDSFVPAEEPMAGFCDEGNESFKSLIKWGGGIPRLTEKML
jgi:hypothetical protein